MVLFAVTFLSTVPRVNSHPSCLYMATLYLTYTPRALQSPHSNCTSSIHTDIYVPQEYFKVVTFY